MSSMRPESNNRRRSAVLVTPQRQPSRQLTQDPAVGPAISNLPSQPSPPPLPHHVAPHDQQVDEIAQFLDDYGIRGEEVEAPPHWANIPPSVGQVIGGHLRLGRDRDHRQAHLLREQAVEENLSDYEYSGDEDSDGDLSEPDRRGGRGRGRGRGQGQSSMNWIKWAKKITEFLAKNYGKFTIAKDALVATLRHLGLIAEDTDATTVGKLTKRLKSVVKRWSSQVRAHVKITSSSGFQGTEPLPGSFWKSLASEFGKNVTKHFRGPHDEFVEDPLVVEMLEIMNEYQQGPNVDPRADINNALRIRADADAAGVQGVVAIVGGGDSTPSKSYA